MEEGVEGGREWRKEGEGRGRKERVKEGEMTGQ